MMNSYMPPGAHAAWDAKCDAAAEAERAEEDARVEQVEHHAANMERKGREEDAYSRGHSSYAEYRQSLWRDEER